MLLAVADLKPHWEFVGQDVDLRCVRMTAINLALRYLYGYVIWGNSLGLEKRLIYRTGFNLKGLIREISATDCPVPVQEMVSADSNSDVSDSTLLDTDEQQAKSSTSRQLRLF